jgi:hypothetical protein
MLFPVACITRPQAVMYPASSFGPNPNSPLCGLRDLCAMLSPRRVLAQSGQRQLSFLFWRQLLFPIVLGVIGPFFWRFLGLVFCFRWRRLSAARGEAAEGRRQRRVGGYPRCLIVAVVVDSYGWSSLCFVALGPVTLAVKFQDDRVMNQSIDGRHRRHRILEDFGPLAED